MADLSKNSQVVSNISVPEVVSVCALTPTNTSSAEVLSADLDGPNNESFSDLNLQDGGTSLQELIDSELALRVSESLHESQEEEYEELDPSSEDISYSDPCPTRKPCENNGIVDINTQFIMAERKSCFENMSTNGMHFFTMIDQADDVDPDMIGSSIPENVDRTSPTFNGLTCDLNGDNKEIIDESEDVISSSPTPMNSNIQTVSKSYESTVTQEFLENDSLVVENKTDYIGTNERKVTSDLRESSDDSSSSDKCDDISSKRKLDNFFSPFPEYIDEMLQPQAHQEYAATFSERVSDGEILDTESPEEGAGWAVDHPLEVNSDLHCASETIEDTPDAETHIHGDIDTELSFSALEVDVIDEPIEQNIFDEHSNEDGEFCLVINETNIPFNSLDISHGSSVIPEVLIIEPDPEIEEDLAQDTDSIEILHNGIDSSVDNSIRNTFVHDTVDQVEVCCTKMTDSPTSSSCSDLETNETMTSSSSEKKIIKKKKSDGGDSTKTKKTKKNKKTDSEKENISVILTDYENDLISVETNHDSNHTSNSDYQDIVQDDDLTNVSVKDLKSAYSNHSLSRFAREGAKELDEDIIYCGPIISLKSSFSKFDQLTKKTVLHVRSVDASKVQKQFNQTTAASPEQTSNCRSCGKQVFQMEQVKAERAIWHKNCFRCKECNKQLMVDNYSSNEGVLYCMPHFKELFKPKAVPDEDTEPPSDKPDLGLEELTALNVKSRYQVFEKTDSDVNSVERSPSSVSVKRSPSILSKLARFQAKGMDIGVTDDSFNNVPYEESSSSSEEELEDENEVENGDKDLIRSNRKQKERPMSFNKMGDMKCRWESGHTSKEERREERKQEIQNIRSRLFMGKQGKMKEMYEQAVQDSERGTQKKDVDISSDKAKSIKERFERGEIVPDEDDENVVAKLDQHRRSKEEELSIFEEGISKKSRSLFLELDAKTQQQPLLMSPTKSPLPKDDVKKIREISLTPQISKDVVKSTDAVEDVKVETSELFSKFKFFETYKEPEREKKKFRITPPREGQIKESSPDNIIYRDPEVVRSEDKLQDEVIKTKTASKMLSIFRQMEENATKEELPEGPKPLKRFTPPPDYTRESETSDEESEEEEEEEEEEGEEEDDQRDGNPNIIRASDKVEDEFLKQATTAARAKALRAKFERWEEKENKLNTTSSSCNLDIDQTDQASIDSTKSLRAKFESLKNDVEQPKERSRPKVNRFVEIQATSTPLCSTCNEKVYPLERIEASGKIFHKQCFRCLQCNCVLRMETYTFNNNKLYCLTHFKQLFIAKGNYEEGFGFDQHKRKWNTPSSSNDIFKDNLN